MTVTGSGGGVGKEKKNCRWEEGLGVDGEEWMADLLGWNWVG